MTTLTPALIATTTSDDQLFGLIGMVLEERLPNGRSSTDEFVRELRALPRGLRAMAAIYELDVSLSLDDLGWHFGNWHNKALAEETALGLEELGADEMAHIFRDAYALAEPYWSELGAENWNKWYFGSSLDEALAPLNQRAWEIQKQCGGSLLEFWVSYARRYPERLSP
jgi:hypothetical protein